MQQPIDFWIMNATFNSSEHGGIFEGYCGTRMKDNIGGSKEVVPRRNEGKEEMEGDMLVAYD